MFLNVIYSDIKKFYIVTFFTISNILSLDNLFLTAKTIYNWNFHSIATSTVQPFVAKYHGKECGDPNEMASNNDDDKDHDDDDDDSMSKDN